VTVFETLAQVVGLLRSRGVPHALIGAAAMSGMPGGPQDAADVGLILAASDREAIRAEVEARVASLSPESVALWRTIVGHA
jgi:hypothetical protein